MNNGKPDFHPDQIGGADTLDGQMENYDEKFLEALGEPETLTDDQMEQIVQGVTGVLKWFADAVRTSRPEHVEKKLACRVVGLLYLLDPGYFDGAPSLRELAKRIGVDKMAIARHTADARRAFGIQNRMSSFAHNFKGDTPQRKEKDRHRQVSVEEKTQTLQQSGSVSPGRLRE